MTQGFDTDNWETKLGMVRGCLLAYSAPIEVMECVQWMYQHIEVDTAGQALDQRLNQLMKEGEASLPRGSKAKGSFQPIDNFDQPDPPKKSKKEKDTSNGISAAEPPANKYGLPAFGEKPPEQCTDCLQFYAAGEECANCAAAAGNEEEEQEEETEEKKPKDAPAVKPGALSLTDKARAYIMREKHGLTPKKIVGHLPHIDIQKLRGYLGNVLSGAVKKPSEEDLAYAQKWFNELTAEA